MGESAEVPTTLPGIVGPRRIAGVRTSSLTLDLVVVSGVALVLGLIRLGMPSLWVDESFTVNDVARPVSSYVDGYYLLFYLVMKPWTLVAGTSEWALRLPSVVGAMLSCSLLVVLGRRLFDRWVALAAGLLLATSPFMVRWSQQARGYTMMVAVVLGATLLLLRALERGTRSAWALYGIGFAAVMVWHPVAGLLLAAPHAVLAYQRRERLLPHCLLAVALILAFGVTWSAQLAMRSGDGSIIAWIKYPTADVAARALLDVSGATGLGLVLALLGLLLLWRRGEGATSVWLATWAFSPFVVSLLASLVQPIFLDRYLIMAAPAFALLGAFALFAAGPRWGAVLVGAAVVATAFGLVQGYTRGSEGWRGEDWREAVTVVQQRRDEATSVVVVPWWAAPAATYYGASASSASTADSIWVLNWSESGHELSPAVRRPLGFGDHQLVEQRDFGRRLSVQLWRRAP